MAKKTIYITDQISNGWGGISLNDIKRQMKGVKKDDELTVIINSPGGSVFEGIAIFNFLRDYKPTVRIIGIAASIASIIALAGKKIVMAPGAMFMVHEPWTFAIGNEQEMQEVSNRIGEIKTGMVEAYQIRMNKTDEEVLDWIKVEKYLNGKQAKELGIADEYNAPAQEGDYSMNAITSFAALKNLENKSFINKTEPKNMATVEELQNQVNSLQSTINDKDSELNTAKSKISDLENSNSKLEEDLKQAKVQSLNNKKAQIESEEEQFVSKLIEEKKVEASQKDFLVSDLVNKRLDENKDAYNSMKDFLNSKTVNPLTQPQATKQTADGSASFDTSDFNNEEAEERILAAANKLSKAENITFEEALNKLQNEAEGQNV